MWRLKHGEAIICFRSRGHEIKTGSLGIEIVLKGQSVSKTYLLLVSQGGISIERIS